MKMQTFLAIHKVNIEQKKKKKKKKKKKEEERDIHRWS